MTQELQTVIFRAVLVVMFSIIMSMSAYILAGVNTAIEMTNHRIDMLISRLNDMDRRITVSETKLAVWR